MVLKDPLISFSLTLLSFEVRPIMSFVTSNRGGQKFIDDNNFVYVFSKKSANEEHYIRVCKKRSQCKATRIPVLNIPSRIKERARNTEETLQQILATNLQNVHCNIMAKLPRQDAIKRSMQCNEQGLDEQFLKYDFHDTLVPDRILIFDTDDNLNMLNRSDSWYGDGTFSVAPNLFFQLYTIHVEQYGTVIELKIFIPGLFPTRILLDFKAAAMGAFSEEFEGIVVSGCFFHLCQNVWRRVQSEGLQIEFSRYFSPEAQPIMDYFEDIYIGRRGRRQRRPPFFPIQMWNMYQRTLDHHHRTNNHIEGWHRGFQSVCDNSPNIFKFIESLKKQQTIHSYQINQFITGVPLPRLNNLDQLSLTNRRSLRCVDISA
ncbi:hypothetical protein RN001_009158 [Aquatica leii]|uniref:MULE transposase domain-containing protein n=1 Tax=Aquatica leii TaxID=1421715 RepID=A0AAN7PV35_9COLE|nr:hypothetical protein RN001_009158 [Aquatica leii]